MFSFISTNIPSLYDNMHSKLEFESGKCWATVGHSFYHRDRGVFIRETCSIYRVDKKKCQLLNIYFGTLTLHVDYMLSALSTFGSMAIAINDPTQMYY